MNMFIIYLFLVYGNLFKMLARIIFSFENLYVQCICIIPTS